MLPKFKLVVKAEKHKVACADVLREEVEAGEKGVPDRALRKPQGPRPGSNPHATKFKPASARGLNVYAPEFYPSQQCFF
ncbi:hypothetical protein HDU77_011011 [Chytriomyces hyalinus]|nr:hypothetical protein HDU77_011011 [Chytriomyces hyalinus]